MTATPAPIASQSAEKHLHEFERRVALARTGLLARMTRAPVRYPWSKVLQAAAGLLRVSLPARGWTFFGDVMSLRFPDPVSMFIHRYGFFEEGLREVL